MSRPSFGLDAIPVVRDLIRLDPVELQERAAPSSPVPGERLPFSGQVDAQEQPVGDDRAIARQRRGARKDDGVGSAELDQVAVRQPSLTGHQAQLVQGDAGSGLDRERHRDDFEKELSLVAVTDLVEVRAVIGDDAREDVEPAGRAPRVRPTADASGQPDAFLERDQVRAVLLEHGPIAGQVKVAHVVVLKLLADLPGGREEAAPKTVGDRPEREVDARRLEIAIRDLARPRRCNPPR